LDLYVRYTFIYVRLGFTLEETLILRLWAFQKLRRLH
jgi:hypothetical protein